MAGVSILTPSEVLWINRQFRRLMETAGQRLRPINNEFNILDIGGGTVPADGPGEVLVSVDGLTFTSELPLTAPGNGSAGWLVNDGGYMLVVG